MTTNTINNTINSTIYNNYAKGFFNAAVEAWKKGNVREYDRNRTVLEQMVANNAISKEVIRDLNGMVCPFNPF